MPASVTRHVDDLCFSPDGKTLGVATSALTGPIWDGQLDWFSADALDKVAGSAHTFSGISQIDFINNELVAAACDDGRIMLLPTISSSESQQSNQSSFSMGKFQEHADTVSAVSVNRANPSAFVSASFDTTVKIWRQNEPSASEVTFNGHTSEVWAAKWNPHDTTMIATGSKDGVVHIWDPREKNAVLKMLCTAGVCSLDWADSNTLVCGLVNGGVCVYSTKVLEAPTFATKCHTNAVRSVKWDPSGKMVATASDDTTCRVVDPSKDGVDPKSNSRVVHKGNDYVRGVAWRPNSSTALVCAGWEKTLVEVSV